MEEVFILNCVPSGVQAAGGAGVQGAVVHAPAGGVIGVQSDAGVQGAAKVYILQGGGV